MESGNDHPCITSFGEQHTPATAWQKLTQRDVYRFKTNSTASDLGFRKNSYAAW
jgi:hypothetical protein